jgi:serine/threonine protein kinase
MIEIGQKIGNYHVIAKLSEGGMGVVYLAVHPVIGREVALKAIHPEYARNVEMVGRFITEAKSVNQIGHEHIVDVTDFGTTAGGDFYFIMEKLRGEPLADRIAREAPFSLERAVHVASQIAQALQASHDHGVIHRDLKPDNIFLVKHGDDTDFVKVLDFGLAKLVGAGGPIRNSRSGTIVGTPYYMAPEQCDGQVDIDHRADVYALGVLLFEMLTGKVPFGGKGCGEVMLKHMTVPAPHARTIVPTLAPAVDAVLSRALAKDPAQRFQSMDELAEALADSEAHASSRSPLGSPDGLSGRIRARQPLKRAGMTLRATVSERPVGRSTLLEGAGEISEDRIPRPHHRRGIVLAALAGSFVVLSPSRAYKAPMARVVAAAHALSQPASVRLNFNSDPDGATVSRADGTVLGSTPLSIEAAFGDAPTAFLLNKRGFVPKRVAIVPNLPSPIFAVLERAELDDPPLPLSDSPPLPIVSREPEPRHKAHTSHFDPRAISTDSSDWDEEDDTLPPKSP